LTTATVAIYSPLKYCRKRAFRANFFLTNCFSDKRDSFLKGDDIRALANMVIWKPLTYSSNLAKLSLQQVQIDYSDSKKWLEDLTGEAITTFGVT